MYTVFVLFHSYARLYVAPLSVARLSVALVNCRPINCRPVNCRAIKCRPMKCHRIMTLITSCSWCRSIHACIRDTRGHFKYSPWHKL